MGIFISIGKFIILLMLSMVQSFNYINNIPFLLLYFYKLNNLNFSNYIYLSFSLVIYEITKYFFKFFSIKMMRLIGIHEYLSLSIGSLIIIQIGFSVVFYYYKYLILFIFYRIFLSLFNNLSSFITFPLSRLYNNKKMNIRLEYFSFFQKIFNFLIFLISNFFLTNLNSFSYFCLLLSIINIICFILYLITFICNNKHKERQYYPQISEKFQNKKNNSLNLIKEHNNKINHIINNNNDIKKLNNNKNNINTENFGDNTNLEIISGEIKNKFYLNNRNNKNNNNIENHEGSINFCKNLNEIANNKTIKNNYNDNSFKNKLYQKNNSNINNSEIINKIESSSDVVLGQFYGDNKNKNKIEVNYNNLYQKPNSFQSSNNQNNHISNNINININIDKNIIKNIKNKNININNNLTSKKKKKTNFSKNSFVYLILIHSIFKFIHYFSIFLLLIKFFELKLILKENIINYKINFINSPLNEIIILFACYYFIHMILFLINKFLTIIIIKGGCFIKYFIFYFLQLFYFLSMIAFLFLFLNTIYSIRKNIILIFVFELIISEISMILLIYYNKLAVNKGINQHILKETKSIGVLIGAFLFLLFNIFRGIFLYIIKTKINFFDCYFLYTSFSIFFLILFIIGLFF